MIISKKILLPVEYSEDNTLTIAKDISKVNHGRMRDNKVWTQNTSD